MLITRADVLKRYGLPDVATFEMAAQQDRQGTLHATLKHGEATVSISLDHLASLEHEICPADPGLATQIRAVLKSLGYEPHDSKTRSLCAGV